MSQRASANYKYEHLDDLSHEVIKSSLCVNTSHSDENGNADTRREILDVAQISSHSGIVVLQYQML